MAGLMHPRGATKGGEEGQSQPSQDSWPGQLSAPQEVVGAGAVPLVCDKASGTEQEEGPR